MLNNCLSDFEMLSSPLNVGIPAACEIPAPVDGISHDNNVYHVCFILTTHNYNMRGYE